MKLKLIDSRKNIHIKLRELTIELERLPIEYFNSVDAPRLISSALIQLGYRRIT